MSYSGDNQYYDIKPFNYNDNINYAKALANHVEMFEFIDENMLTKQDSEEIYQTLEEKTQELYVRIYERINDEMEKRIVDKITQHLKINEKVSTDNEILRADNEELRTVNKRLMDDNERLKKENKVLRNRDMIASKYFNEIKNFYNDNNNNNDDETNDMEIDMNDL
tara:strand:+ start:203 stop:700 length:498 start_codon:yes stop_codon:yes gene_type:complete